MSVRIHTTPIYQIEYGDAISSDLTDTIIELIRESETGYISENECDLEIDFSELEEIIKKTRDKNLKEALKKIIQESDKNNQFIHLSIF